MIYTFLIDKILYLRQLPNAVKLFDEILEIVRKSHDVYNECLQKFGDHKLAKLAEDLATLLIDPLLFED